MSHRTRQPPRPNVGRLAAVSLQWKRPRTALPLPVRVPATTTTCLYCIEKTQSTPPLVPARGASQTPAAKIKNPRPNRNRGRPLSSKPVPSVASANDHDCKPKNSGCLIHRRQANNRPIEGQLVFGFRTNGSVSAGVAQIFNLPYRRLAVGRPLTSRKSSGFQIRDTADCKSALRLPQSQLPPKLRRHLQNKVGVNPRRRQPHCQPEHRARP